VKTLVLPATLERALAQGHPWVYRDHLPRDFQARTGDWVRARAGRWSGFGLHDAEGALALRVFSAKGIPDADWVGERVRAAWDLRAPIRARGDTDTYRWLNGEGDFLPGIVVDLYGDYAVLVTDSPAVEPLVPWVVAALGAVRPLAGILWRQRDPREEGDRRLSVLVGGAPPERLVVRERGLSFVVSLEAGQKTGLFLDQRENRCTVETLAAGRRVLNLFSYTGGFSLYAARGGARETTSVDLSKGATRAAEQSFEASGLAGEGHRFVAADVFEFLEAENASASRHDLVVCDPPSFARSQQQLEQAERAYVRVNTAALRVVEDGGLLASSSCTARVGPAAFQRCLAEAAARAGRRLQILHDAGHALDHPIALGHPEGRYLKFIVARVLRPA
jgi:23S rRNA (cytosine1962-C5)-methyltransferase